MITLSIALQIHVYVDQPRHGEEFSIARLSTVRSSAPKYLSEEMHHGGKEIGDRQTA